jgi:hypothetical protein
MNIAELLSIGLFTIAVVITVMAWNDRLGGTNAAINEAFEGSSKMKDMDKESLQQLEKLTSGVSEEEASAAYETVLQFIKKDFARGAILVQDMTRRFYGNAAPQNFREDLNVSALMDNYSNPLQRVR